MSIKVANGISHIYAYIKVATVRYYGNVNVFMPERGKGLAMLIIKVANSMGSGNLGNVKELELLI